MHSSFVMYQLSGRASSQKPLKGLGSRTCTTTLLLCPPFLERNQLTLYLAVKKLPEAVLVIVWFMCICSVASVDPLQIACYTIWF